MILGNGSAASVVAAAALGTVRRVHAELSPLEPSFNHNFCIRSFVLVVSSLRAIHLKVSRYA